MSDRDFVDAFEACTFPGPDFHHAEHIRLAWVYLRQHPLLTAIERFTSSLRRFAAHQGAAGKYHETITWAYLLLINQRMNGEASFHDFRAANPDLFTWEPSIIDLMYRPETIVSERARKVFVLPDLGAAGRVIG